MKKVIKQILCISMTFLLYGCGQTGTAQDAKGNTDAQEDARTMSEVGKDEAATEDSEGEKDFAELSPGKQEEAYNYRTFFLPAIDGVAQPDVGDTMPYYEDGVYYIYYLKDGGDSYNHSIFLTTTTDFISYSEQDEVVIEASDDGSQDSWIGTGSVVKVDGKYYFFYTGHTDSSTAEYKEKIMVAESDNLTAFQKRQIGR